MRLSPIEGKLILLVMLLALSVSFVGVWIARAPNPLIRGSLGSGDFAAVPYSPSLRLPYEVRVNLVEHPVSTIRIAIDAPYSINFAGVSKSNSINKPLKLCVAAAVPAGIRIGSREFRGDSIEMTPEQSPAIWVEGHQYRGRLRLFSQPGGKLIAVNVVPLEDYVASAVDSEMPASFPQAARQAQAIVARTYAAYQTQRNKNNAFYDVHATSRSQNYLGYQFRGRDGRLYAGESASSCRVTDQTRGIVCLYDGELFSTYYTAVCGGRTIQADLVFDGAPTAMRSVKCDGCRAAELYRWVQEMPLSEFSTLLRRHFASQKRRFGNLASFQRTLTTQNIYEPAFEISDHSRQLRMSALEVRRLCPSGFLHSYQFEPHLSGDRVVFEGRGHGHGVGLCQWGARGMALDHFGPIEIVRHYYPKVDVVRCQ